MRLVDELEVTRRELGLELLAEIDVCGQFGDLWWPPLPSLDELTVLSTTDPAFTLTGHSRWVALQRILGELRCYAGPLTERLPTWWHSAESRERVAAVKAEPQHYELCELATIEDVVRFACRYLAGESLASIEIPRKLR